MTSKFEEKCRDIIEEIYNTKFPSCKPLVNPKTKRPLQIDLYNEKKRLGFECQGNQHYEFPNYWHKTYEEYIAQIVRDQCKYDLCVVLEITLVRIPYTFEKGDLRNNIIELLKKKDIYPK